MFLPSRAFFAEEAVSASENCTNACKDYTQNELVLKPKDNDKLGNKLKHTDLEPGCLLKGSNLMNKPKSRKYLHK
jgi:hypothetical protein